MNRLQRLLASLALMALAVTSSGCMLSPNDGQLVGNRDSYVNFQISTLGQADTVQIQAVNYETGQWQTIGEMSTYIGPLQWQGYDWYLGSDYFQIPHECWDLKFAGHTVDRIYYTAEVRALSSTGKVQTFRNGFNAWFRDGDQWNRGWSNTRTISEVDAWNNGRNSVRISTWTINL